MPYRSVKASHREKQKQKKKGRRNRRKYLTVRERRDEKNRAGGRIGGGFLGGGVRKCVREGKKTR